MKTHLSIRIFLLSLAMLVLFNGMGVYVVAYAKTGMHRLSREANGAELQKLVLNGEEFSGISWIGKADFIYKGRVYDCESINSSNGKVTISCYADKEETDVKNLLAESFEKHTSNSDQQKTIKEVFKFFPVFPFDKNTSITNDNSCNADMLREFRNNAFNSPGREIASPPPEKA